MSVNSSTSTVSNNVQSQQSFSPFDANPFISYTGMKNQQIIDMHSKVNFNSDNNISNTAGKPNTIIQKTREKTPLSSESDSAQYAGSHVGHTSSKNTEENKMGVNLRQLLSLDSPGQIRIDHINGMKPNNPFNNTAPQGMSMSIAQQKPQLEK